MTYLTDRAEEMAEEDLRKDMGLLSAWLDQQAGEGREPSCFGPIRTTELIGDILFNRHATAIQRAAAADELLRRYLAENREEVERKAESFLQP